MLVLTRKIGETIIVGENIEITVTRIDRNAVRLSIQAPKKVRILRREVYDAISEAAPGDNQGRESA